MKFVLFDDLIEDDDLENCSGYLEEMLEELILNGYLDYMYGAFVEVPNNDEIKTGIKKYDLKDLDYEDQVIFCYGEPLRMDLFNPVQYIDEGLGENPEDYDLREELIERYNSEK